MNKFSLILLFSLLPNIVLGFENLVLADYMGKWISNENAPRGIDATLEIREDKSSKFIRTLTGGKIQNMSGDIDSLSEIDGLVVIQYNGSKTHSSYKLVLSGWKSTRDKQIFGTAYLYDMQGKLFNGLPVSFKSID